MARPPSRKPTVRDVLVAKLGHPDRFTLRRLADGARKRYGPMSRDESYAVLANEHGIPVHKYLSGDDLTRVRAIISAGPTRSSAAPARNGRRSRVKADTRLKEIVIDGASLVMDDPILPPRVAADARRMAGVYPLPYVLLNTLRALG